MEKNSKRRELSGGTKAFFKALTVTVSAVLLILIGYFTAAYFSGGM